MFARRLRRKALSLMIKQKVIASMPLRETTTEIMMLWTYRMQKLMSMRTNRRDPVHNTLVRKDHSLRRLVEKEVNLLLQSKISARRSDSSISLSMQPVTLTSG